ncbi:hypothetical protein ACF1CG_36890 [Streptomyces sp. NPDC014773]|uniref:hypothetical protein n=1 Tax=Streptomyces sp. NPDC014773 TaxID=3364908 RepID=UPI0036F63BCA
MRRDHIGHTSSTPHDEFIPDEIRVGRRSRFRFTQTPQWALLMLPLSDAGYRAYSLLLAHVNTQRDDTVVWPHQKSLAAMLGKRPEAVSRVITKELKPLGLVDVEPVRYGANRSRQRNIYTVHEEPPEGWEGHASLSEWYADHKPETGETAGQTGHAKNRVSGDAKDRAPEDAKDRVGNYTKPELDESGTTSAPSARSAGDARRASAGSSARATRGGSAASASKSDASKGRGAGSRMTREQAAALRTVEAGIPFELAPLLPKYRPTVVRDAILAAVSNRTAEQIVDRINRRWIAWGYSLKVEDGTIERPVGVLVRLLRDSKCPDPLCEDGTTMDTDTSCRMCEVRRADRRQATHRGEGVPAQRPAVDPGHWTCVDCERTGTGQGPADGVCRDCEAAAEAAATALVQKLSAEAEEKAARAEVARQRAAQLEVEVARERAEAEAAALQAAELRRAPVVDEETLRLRARLVAENPWMAKYTADQPKEGAPAPS